MRLAFRRRQIPAAPYAFFSYGMTKSGSTLAFQLTRAAMEAAGWDQSAIRFSAARRQRNINFLPEMAPSFAREISDRLAETGTPIALKTHAAPTPLAAGWVEAGTARGHAVFRDPRDMALSLMDHGRRARANGQRGFANIETLEDACRAIEDQLGRLSAWLQLPGIQPMQ